MRIITTSGLKIWAESRTAKGRFPRLVRDLILAVVKPDKIRRCHRMTPSGCRGVRRCCRQLREESIRTGGVYLSGKWERRQGSGRRPPETTKRTKGTTAVPSKTEQFGGLNRSQITFVSTTPLIWRDDLKQTWVDARRAEEDLERRRRFGLLAWTSRIGLRDAPSVCLQFASELNLVPDGGLWTPDQAWDDWSPVDRADNLGRARGCRTNNRRAGADCSPDGCAGNVYRPKRLATRGVRIYCWPLGFGVYEFRLMAGASITD